MKQLQQHHQLYPAMTSSSLSEAVPSSSSSSCAAASPPQHDQSPQQASERSMTSSSATNTTAAAAVAPATEDPAMAREPTGGNGGGGQESVIIKRRGEYAALCKWSISNFPRVKARALWSKYFEVGGYDCRLLVYPKGDSQALPGYISATYKSWTRAALPRLNGTALPAIA